MHTRYAPVRHSHSPEGPFTVRLACIRPAASVHPEPGSNSSLYYCCTQISVLNLGFRLDVLFTVPLLRFLLPDGAPAPPVLCWPQTFKELLASVSPLFVPSSVPKAGAKVQLFPIRATFFSIILKLFYITLIIIYLKQTIFLFEYEI